MTTPKPEGSAEFSERKIKEIRHRATPAYLREALAELRQQLDAKEHLNGLLNARLAELDSRHPEYGKTVADLKQKLDAQAVELVRAQRYLEDSTRLHCDEKADLRAQLSRMEGELGKAHRWITQNSEKWSGDWACMQCHPNSDMLIEGFVCAVHQARAGEQGKGGGD